MQEIDKILLLQNIPGFGLSKIKRFIKDNQFFIDDDDNFKYLVNTITGRNCDYYMDRVKIIKDSCNKLDIKIRKCQNYNIIDTPLILYTKGNTGLLEINVLGVIGTRNPSELGSELGETYVKHLVKRGWITISGLARGCDTIAHNFTVMNGGKTIAVLPMGYRPETAPWILEDGLIISEYPPYSKLEKYKCINRNRIITGLAKGLFVIESLRGGGSEHSIKFAHRGNIPIAYALGFQQITEYSAQKINNTLEFDLFLQNCIN